MDAFHAAPVGDESGPASCEYEAAWTLWSAHTGPVSATKFSPDGLIVATASADAKCQLIDADHGRVLQTLSGHEGGVSDLAWSCDGAYAASASDDCSVRLWDIATGKAATAPFKGHLNYVFCVDFSPRGNLLASGSFDESLRLWDIRAGRSIRTIPAHSEPVTSVQFNGDGTVLATGSYDGLIRLWDVASGHCLTTLQLDDKTTLPPISCVRWSPNSRFVLASSLDGRLRLWDYMLGKPAKTFSGHDNHTLCCAAGFTGAVPAEPAAPRETHAEGSAGSASAAAAGTSAVAPAVGGIGSGAASATMDVDHSGPADTTMQAAATSVERERGDDGSRAPACWQSPPVMAACRTCVASGSEDGRLHLWDVNTRERVASVRAHTGPLLALDCHPWLNSFVTAGGGNGDFSVKLWRPVASPGAAGAVT